MARNRYERERSAEAKLREGVKPLKGIALKIKSGITGYPDRLVIWPGGRVTWVELKRDSGGVLSEIQKVRHARLRKMGHEVVVLSGTEEVAAWLSSCTTTSDEA